MERVADDARCFGCDYRLANLAEPRCPECGRAFSAADASTVNTTGQSIGWWRVLIRPPGVVLFLLTLPVIVVPPWCARTPGGVEFHAQIALILYSILAAVAYIARWLVAAFVRSYFAYPKDLARARSWRWFVTPTMVLLAWLMPLGAITTFSFEYSRSEMEAYAKEIQQNPLRTWPSRRTGILNVKVDEASPGQVRFFCGYGYDGTRRGYTYSPTVDATMISFTSSFNQTHLAGPWYEYWDHSRPGIKSISSPPRAAVTQPATNPGH